MRFPWEDVFGFARWIWAVRRPQRYYVGMNPYNPPRRLVERSTDGPQHCSAVRTSTAAPHWLSCVARLAFCYPCLLIGAFYGTWGLAWLVLGHRPRPSLDDPTEIAHVVSIIYFITGGLLVTFPGVGILGVVAYLLAPATSPARRVTRSVTMIVWYAATIMFLRWDPLVVSKWFLD